MPFRGFHWTSRQTRDRARVMRWVFLAFAIAVVAYILLALSGNVRAAAVDPGADRVIDGETIKDCD